MTWLSGWAKRIELTIDNTNVDSDLSNFPVLIYVSAASGIGNVDVSAVFDELTSNANRKKIAVTTSDGTTQCYVEIERWDDANEKAWLWVKVPTVTAASTATLYLYYDSAKADNTTYVGDTGDVPAQSVWDSNFVGVWHMAQDPNGDGANALKDSTSNIIHATPHGSMTTADLVDGQVGKAIDFDESNDYLATPSADDVLNLTDTITLEAIFKPTYTLDSGLSVVKGLISRMHIPNYNEDSYGILINTSGKLHFGSFGGNIQGTITSWASTSWHYIAGTYNSDGLIGDLFANGTKESLTIDNYDTMAGATNSLVIGANAIANLFPGIIDEIRISKIIRADAWIKATYYSSWDNINSFGSEETETEDTSFSENALVEISLSLDPNSMIFIGDSVFKQDPWVLNTLHYGKDNADKVEVGNRSGNGMWGFTKQLDKLCYNEGDEVKCSNSPVFNIDFTGVPITPIHKPCGYWHSQPTDQLGGDPPSLYLDKCDDSKMAWDYDTSAETIGRSASVLIAITDDGISGSPYIWELDAQSIANGFSLGNRKTLGLTNSLCSDNAACGSCLIMVTGCDGLGTYVLAYVKCTWGEWIHKTGYDGQCLSPGGGYCDIGVFIKLYENKKIWQSMSSCLSYPIKCKDSPTCPGTECNNWTSDECLPWNCADFGGYVLCNEACCLTTCAQSGNGFCFFISNLYNYEWEC